MGISDIASLINLWAAETTAQAQETAEGLPPFRTGPAKGNGSDKPRAVDEVMGDIRFMCSFMDLPPFALALVAPGHWSGGSAEHPADVARRNLTRLVKQYLEEIKEDLEAAAHGLSEDDQDLEEALKNALYARIGRDPEAERLIKVMGGAFPPPLDPPPRPFLPPVRPLNSSPEEAPAL